MIFLELFSTFFKIGLFTVGGGYAMLPFIQSEVLRLGWMPAEMIINFIAVSESTPGPFAVNVATYVGSVMGKEYGVLGSAIGSFCATAGVVLPSFIIILIVAKFFEKFKENKYVKGVMTGLKPAVVGLIGAAIISMVVSVLFPALPGTFNFKEIGSAITKAFTSPEFYISVLTAAAMTILAFKKKHPILIIAISAGIGIIAGYALNLPI